MNYTNNTNHLDLIKKNYGKQNLHGAFTAMCKNNKRNALQFINSSNLSFPTLFELLPEIEYYRLFDGLNIKNQYAVRMCRNENLYISQKTTKSILEWAVTTSVKENETSKEFDEFLDKTISTLLITYKDMSVLPETAELIFARNRNGGHIHDLAWCFFKSENIATMPLIAEYIRSENDDDNKLAYKLLNFKPELQPDSKEQQYHNFSKWFSENRKFLYSTGQSMNQTNKPKAWRADLTAKYLHEPICNKKTLPPEKQNIANEFESIGEQDKKTLAKHSFRLYNRDLMAWNSFMRVPVHEQINLVKTEAGGLQ